MQDSAHDCSQDGKQYGEWMPLIAQDLCNRCGECIAVCPTGALGWQNNKASLVNPSRCGYCATCETICPTAAIELPYLVIKDTTSEIVSSKPLSQK